MTFPSKKELEKMRKKLEKADPSYLLPENATKVEKLKYELCKKFVVYIRKNKVAQIELAKKLNIDPARLSEIVRYKIHLFTADKLMEFAQRLDPNLDVKVA